MCKGDRNEGNQIGIHGGLSIIGHLADPPFGLWASDGTRVLVTHQWELLRGQTEGADVVVYGHTHRAAIKHRRSGQLLINPGEAGGWAYGRPSVAILETRHLEAALYSLLEEYGGP